MRWASGKGGHLLEGYPRPLGDDSVNAVPRSSTTNFQLVRPSPRRKRVAGAFFALRKLPPPARATLLFLPVCVEFRGAAFKVHLRKPGDGFQGGAKPGNVFRFHVAPADCELHAPCDPFEALN